MNLSHIVTNLTHWYTGHIDGNIVVFCRLLVIKSNQISYLAATMKSFIDAPLIKIKDVSGITKLCHIWLKLAVIYCRIMDIMICWSSITNILISMYFPCDTVYPKKYARGFCFAVLCCGYTLTDFPISIRLTSLALWQSNDCHSASKATLMNMDKYLMWIHYERLHNHNKAKHNKTVCIFLGIYCTKVRNLWTRGVLIGLGSATWDGPELATHIQNYSISQEICTRFCCALLCCGYVIVHNEFTWSIYPYSSGLLCWHWGNR